MEIMTNWLNKVHFGDCLETLKRMPDGIVNTCVTSPPYFGLRDYSGGDAEIGKEKTPDEFIAALVAVFREVRRVLRDDGTLWVNCGDSYSAGVANISDLVQSEIENGIIFCGSADPRGRSPQRINVLVYDKRAPNFVFAPLFTAKRVSIKQGQQDLCEIGGAFDAPVKYFGSCALGSGSPCDTNTELLMDVPEYVGIIVAAGDLYTDAALRSAIAVATLPIKNGKAPLTIEIAAEPEAEGITSSVPAFDSVTLNATTKCSAQVNSVNDPVALLDGSDFAPGGCGHFTVRQASSEKLSFTLHGGADVCFIGVGHLFLFNVGLAPYSIILDKAERKWNSQRPKQELGIPDMLKRALMEDGWICRQTIIWSKPNPMPESVTDRCTKAHEQIFLLSKSPKYYYDQGAIKEPVTQSTVARLSQDLEHQVGSDRVPGKTNGNMKAVGRGGKNAFRGQGHFREGDNGPANREGCDMQDVGAGDTRNKRSVWTVSTKPYSGAHFAVFPADLIEPCILAGAPAGGVVLDPFMGSGTTAQVSQDLGRQWIGCELNRAYEPLQNERIAQMGLTFPD